MLRLDIPHRADSTIGRVTLSIGVASLVPGQDGAAEGLVTLADEALYQAKHDGRNRVQSARISAV